MSPHTFVPSISSIFLLSTRLWASCIKQLAYRISLPLQVWAVGGCRLAIRHTVNQLMLQLAIICLQSDRNPQIVQAAQLMMRFPACDSAHCLELHS